MHWACSTWLAEVIRIPFFKVQARPGDLEIVVIFSMRFKGGLPYLLSNISSLLCSWNGKSHQGAECYILLLPITTYGLLSPLQGPLDHNAVSPPPLSSIRSISRQDGFRSVIVLAYSVLKTGGVPRCHFGLSLLRETVELLSIVCKYKPVVTSSVFQQL